MSSKNNRDYIYLIWKDNDSRTQYTVGELSKNGKYEFKYIIEINEAIKKGFKPFISMNDINKTYCSDELFPIFSSRLPDERRRDIDKILQKYELSEYDEFELLRKSGTELPIDTLKFIDPKLDREKDFYLAGVRYYLGCDKTDCEKVTNVNVNDVLKLVPEPENKKDKHAIAVYDGNKKVGYIPRYYNKQILKRLKNENNEYELIIKEFNKNNRCSECIKVTLKM